MMNSVKNFFTLIFFLAVALIPAYGQLQLGSDIDGEAVEDLSGRSVATSADGSRVAIGATNNDGNGEDSGQVRVYEWDGTTWKQLGSDIDGEAAGDYSGHSVALSSDGNKLAIGAWGNDGNGNNSGYVRIYSWDGSSAWTQLGSDINGEAAGEQSGWSVSLSSDGNKLAIGAPFNDKNGNNVGLVRVYSWDGSTWTKLGSDIDGEAADDESGYSVSLSADGSRVAIGALRNGGNGEDSGHARIYSWDGSAWTQMGSDIDGEAADDRSGRSVSLSADGNKVAIGAYQNDGNGSNSGHVRIYSWEGSAWVQEGPDIDGEAERDFSGWYLALSSDGSRVAIGAIYNNGNGNNSGHVRVYDIEAFVYDKSSYCMDETDPVPTINFFGGTFGATSGLLVDVFTGEIDLSASRAGTHTVTYEVNGNKYRKIITLIALDNASFSYGSTGYCMDEADPTPTVTGLSGGTFSSITGLDINASTGEIDLSASTAGTYAVTYTTIGTCPQSHTQNITLNPRDTDASFRYGSPGYCLDETNPVPTVTGLPGGTFSSTTGLEIDASTGEIDLSASTAGTYTITYTTSGVCPTAAAQNITLNPRDADASFYYGSTSYCQDENNPTPTVTGLSGGTFSSTADLSINSITGKINLSASRAGTHAVTYTTSGVCPLSYTQSITLNPRDDASFSYGSISYCTDENNPIPDVALSGGTFSSSTGLVIDPSSGEINLSTSPEGDHTVTYTTSGICPQSYSQNLTLNPRDADVTFSYGSDSYCQDESDPVPSVTGDTGGAFSSASGLSIDAVTGAIDLSTSPEGDHTVTYTTGGACPRSYTQNITLTARDDASFNYASTSYCLDEADPTPTITGLQGGIFSSTTGLNIDAATGEISLSTSSEGEHTVTYTTGGACEQSATQNITLTARDADASFNYASTSYCLDEADPTPTITGLQGGIFSSTTGLNIDASTGEIDLSASAEGTYAITYTTSGACPQSTAQNITLIPRDADVSFNYASTSYCMDENDPAPIITGLQGGIFSSTPGLNIDASTGEIDLSTSTEGSYTVTYTTSGICPQSHTQTITLNPRDADASFYYASARYCMDEADPAPTVTGLSGGTFSSTTGLVIDAATGATDLSASEAGTYTVTYTTGGACPQSAAQNITLTERDDASFHYASTGYCMDEADPAPTVTGLSGGTFSSNSTDVIINSSTGAIDLSASEAGTYTVTYTTGGVCPQSATQNITLTARGTDVSFSYGSTGYCMDEADPSPAIASPPGGIFSSTNGLVIDASTGEIDLSASTEGTYAVTYTTGGACLQSATQNITLTARDANVSFSYGAASYCIDGADPVPAIASPAGGIFSSTNGLVIDASTGAIDLSASAEGTYTVTYTTGACPQSSTQEVTIAGIDGTVYTDDLSITAVQQGATYQWVDCNNDNAPIPGANFRKFEVNENGSYAVWITMNGCTILSECVDITILSAEDRLFTSEIRVYPNPSSSAFFIDLGHMYDDVELTLYNTSGRMFEKLTFQYQQVLTFSIDGAPGIYLLRVRTNGKNAFKRLVKR